MSLFYTGATQLEPMAELISFMLQNNGFLERVIMLAPFSPKHRIEECLEAKRQIPSHDFNSIYQPLCDWKPEPEPEFYFSDAAVM